MALSGGGGGGTFHGGLALSMGGVAVSMGVALSGGVVVLSMGGGTFHGGLTLVLTWLKAGRGVASMGGSAKPKVLLLAKLLELQYYFAPFSKAAK